MQQVGDAWSVARGPVGRAVEADDVVSVSQPEAVEARLLPGHHGHPHSRGVARGPVDLLQPTLLPLELRQLLPVGPLERRIRAAVCVELPLPLVMGPYELGEERRAGLVDRLLGAGRRWHGSTQLLTPGLRARLGRRGLSLFDHAHSGQPTVMWPFATSRRMNLASRVAAIMARHTAPRRWSKSRLSRKSDSDHGTPSRDCQQRKQTRFAARAILWLGGTTGTAARSVVSGQVGALRSRSRARRAP